MATYVCSDLHGHYSIYESINKKLSKDDRVICLGDATDRGPEGWKMLKAILDNPQWTYLRGNHDQMVIDFIRQNGCALHNQNGGAPTQKAIKSDTPEERKRILKKLIACPYRYEYTNSKGIRFYMSHSGYFVPMDREPTIDEYEDLIWARGCIADARGCDYQFIIHGHTPIDFLRRDLCEARDFGIPLLFDMESTVLMYKIAGQGFAKVDIDYCTVITKKAILLNLEDMTHELIEATEE